MTGVFIFCSIYRQQDGVSSKETWTMGLGLEIFPAEVFLSKTQDLFWGYTYVEVLHVTDFRGTQLY